MKKNSLTQFSLKKKQHDYNHGCIRPTDVDNQLVRQMDTICEWCANEKKNTNKNM